MFPSSLSRALALAVFCLLTACATPVRLGMPSPAPATSDSLLALERWVNLYDQVQGMTQEQTGERLAQLESPRSPGQRYYYGLLNSHLKGYPDWIRARDAFAGLASDVSLSTTQRGLADILRQHNQARINAYVRQVELQSRAVELQKQLVSAEQEKTELQQKIQALTDLETSISTRKEE